MGKNSGGGQESQASVEAERLARIQADQSQEIFGQTAPIRADTLQAITADLADPSRLSGGAIQNPGDITAPALGPINFNSLAQNPQFGAFKDAIETQFGAARQGIIADTPEGGGLFGALGNLGGARASELTRGFGSLASDEAARQERDRAFTTGLDERNRLFGVGLDESNRDAMMRALFGSRANALAAGSGGAAQGISGVGGASGTLGQLAANQASIAESQANRDAGKASGFGSAAGSIAHAAITKNPAAALPAARVMFA